MINKYPQKQDKTISIAKALTEENNCSLEENTTIIPQKTVMQPQGLAHEHISFKERIQNKTFYLCPENITVPSEKLLIKATFQDNNVSYVSLVGNTPPLHMQYIIRGNRLYTITNHVLSPSQYSTLENILFDYMIVDRWYKGKVIHKMRYYYKEKDARSYLGSIHL